MTANGLDGSSKLDKVEANLGCRVQAKALAITCQSCLEGMRGLSEKRSSLESLYNARTYAEIRKSL
jgi:hypothetical protein